jgi:hypothetical protein
VLLCPKIIFVQILIEMYLTYKENKIMKLKTLTILAGAALLLQACASTTIETTPTPASEEL